MPVRLADVETGQLEGRVPMHVKFVYPRWDRPSECHPELASVDASPYIGTPSLAAAALASVTPAEHTV